MTPAVKRLTRAEQQERTRTALLDAAIELFVERGVEATSIEEVTAFAGFTRGAFYSNFASKDDLVVETARRFLEALHAAARPGRDGVPRDAGAAYRERLERLRPVAHGGAAVFLAELTLYALRHPAVKEDVAELHREQLKPAVVFVREQLASAGVKKPAALSYDALANVVQCLTFGVEFFGKIDAPIPAERSLEIAMRALIRGLG